MLCEYTNLEFITISFFCIECCISAGQDWQCSSRCSCPWFSITRLSRCQHTVWTNIIWKEAKLWKEKTFLLASEISINVFQNVLWWSLNATTPCLLLIGLQLIDTSSKIQTSKSILGLDCVQLCVRALYLFKHLSESINQVNYLFTLSVLFADTDIWGMPGIPGWADEWSCSTLIFTLVISGTLLPLSHLFLLVSGQALCL